MEYPGNPIDPPDLSGNDITELLICFFEKLTRKQFKISKAYFFPQNKKIVEDIFQNDFLCSLSR